MVSAHMGGVLRINWVFRIEAMHNILRLMKESYGSRLDTSIAKLLWVDQGSHKSRRDLRHLYSNASKEEQDSIEQHAKAIGQLDLFHELLDETDEVDL